MTNGNVTTVGLTLTSTFNGNFTFTLPTLDNSLVEGPESFTVAALNAAASNGAFATASGIVTTTITDTDTLVLSLTSPTGSSQTVGEGSAPSYTLAIANGIIPVGSTATVDLAITLPGGLTGAEASDFVETFLKDLQDAAGLGVTVGSAVTNGNVTTVGLTLTSTFNGNFTFTLPTLDDSLVEGPESFTVAALNAAASNGAFATASGIVTTTITDTDTLVLSLTSPTGSSQTVGEGSAPSYTLAIASGQIPVGSTATVDLAITLPGGLTGAEASDFVETFLKDLQDAAGLGVTVGSAVTNGNVTTVGLTLASTFNGNFTFTLPTLDDSLVEGPESFTVAALNAAASNGAFATASGSVTTTITDNDTATWSITQSSATVNEGGTTGYTVHLGGTLQSGEDASIVLSLTNVTTNPDGSDLATAAQFDAAVTNAVTAYNAGSDPGLLSYDPATNKLTFTSDGTGAMGNLVINLTAVDDTLMESDESYSVALATPTSTTGSSIALGANSVTTTILANDIDVAPVVDLNGGGSGNNNTVSYPHGESLLPIAPSATITDPNSANLVSMTVTLFPQDNSSAGGGSGGNIKERIFLSNDLLNFASANGLSVITTVDPAKINDPYSLLITGSAPKSVYQTILDGIQYTDTKTGNQSTTPRIVTVVVNDGTLNSATQTVTINGFAPAGVAGEPINLALAAPSADHIGPVSLTIAGIPTGWSLSEGSDNGNSTWTVQTNDIAALSITSPASYTGALVLNVAESWTNADGSSGSASISDNVEVFAKGAPIFAWSGDDTLTGAGAKDLFVFAQPIGNDTIHNFNASEDQIDLIGFAGFASFDDVKNHLTADATGNAVITLADGQSITLYGVSRGIRLAASNFVFDQTPVMNNAGTMTIGDGAMLPLSGIINNTGTIALESAGSTTTLELIQHGIMLQGGGQVTLSDNDANFISSAFPGVTLTNVDNTISGAGQLGDGWTTLINQGTIIATGTHALTIDTGSNVVINSGVLEATGPGSLIVNSDVSNSGLIWADGGNITIEGTVTGTGGALISGGILEFFAASSIDVTFTDGSLDTLVLDNPAAFTGQIFGFAGSSSQDSDLIDLKGVAFDAGTSWTYYDSDGSDTGGTLTIYENIEGTATAVDSIRFGNGDYTTKSFVLTGDGSGGVLVADPATSGSGTVIDAGNGGNTLTGTAASDTFVFKAITDSQPGAGNFDTITNFTHNSDHIDLTAIAGANAVQGPVDAANTADAHSISWFVDSLNNQTIVYVNSGNTANHVDMEIHLTGANINLTGSDILHHT